MTTLTGIKVGAGMVGSFLALFLGGFDTWLQALIILVVLDYITGVLVGILKHELSSSRGYMGLIKKTMIFILVGCAVVVDNLTGFENSARLLVIGFFCTNELISIVENSALAGLPIPESIKAVLTPDLGGVKK